MADAERSDEALGGQKKAPGYSRAVSTIEPGCPFQPDVSPMLCQNLGMVRCPIVRDRVTPGRIENLSANGWRFMNDAGIARRFASEDADLEVVATPDGAA
jgi:hypothetical protein